MENLNLKLKDINDKKLEIRSKLETEENLDLDAVKAELDALEKEEKEIRSKLSTSLETKELKDIKEEKKLEVKNKMEKNVLESMEYRNAFMDFVKTGEMKEEFRAVSLASANTAVIPQPILNTIIEKLENYGNVIPLVTKTSYPAGFSIPVSQLAGPATWTDETTLSTTGVPVGAKTTSPVTFSAYALQKALGISFFAQIQTLSAFEAKVAENVATAMGVAIENAIVDGDGIGKPTGIFTEAATAPSVSLSATLKYKDLVAMKKAIPAMYRNGAHFVMNEETFFELYGIADNAGNPIARVNSDITGSPVYTILGTPVLVTDFAPSYSSAATGDVVAAIIQPDKYILNMAYAPDLRRYTEDATRNTVLQSVALLDGKIADKNGLVAIKKG